MTHHFLGVHPGAVERRSNLIHFLLSSRQLPVATSDCRGALSEMDNAVQQIRDRNLLSGLPFEAPLRVLDLVERYHATADALVECSRLLGTLQIQRYRGDYGL